MTTKELIKEYAKREWPNNEKMAKWVQKHTADALQLNGAILGIDKPCIEKSFGFHDEGPNYDLYKDLCKNTDKMKEYFIYKNTKELHRIVQTLETENCMQYPYVLEVMYQNNGTARLVWEDYSNLMDCEEIENGLKKHEKMPNYVPVVCLAKEDREMIISAYKKVLADFEKRLSVWWKKYGAEKLNTFTYWADR